MQLFSTSILVLSLLIASTVEADARTPSKKDPVAAPLDLEPIRAMIDAGNRVIADFKGIELDVKAGRNDAWTKAVGDLVPAKEAFPETVVPAVRAAGSNADLVKAVKEYFSSSNACIASASKSELTTRQLCNDMSVKEKALDLEVKLAQK